MNNQQFFLHTVNDEFQRFHDVIAAAPSANLDYRPHPKSRSARQMIAHLIGHVEDLVELLGDGVINHRIESEFSDVVDALAKFDAAYAALRAKLQDVSNERWARTADFIAGGQLVMSAPAQTLAWMLLLDSVHHRGQLSSYLRPMGAKVPAIYGQSADSQIAH